MSTEKKPRKPRVVAPKTPLELELEKKMARQKDVEKATKQIARILGPFDVNEQAQIVNQVWASAKAVNYSTPGEPETGAEPANGKLNPPKSDRVPLAKVNVSLSDG